MNDEQKQSCGECEHWDSGSVGNLRFCVCPIPACIDPEDMVPMLFYEGTTCPCFKRKENQ